MGVPELERPRGTWCTHCKVGQGCGIYSERPSVCRGFYCTYLLSPMLGEHWFPGRCKMVVVVESEHGGQRFTITSIPAAPMPGASNLIMPTSSDGRRRPRATSGKWLS